ncbi:response regulator [Engelhardtia mirabilis]|uniref:histidine kinase n=1 Tax=Engelhardtia mirabilis TaxID=2528011 RepID=A0A518BRV7_9BACT|nr:Blue-light-activated protein [Planctomycetes bacterium Pla133]QDV04029.1 Blue-light-activated protein [Planctomycetes bacterium Pla86]
MNRQLRINVETADDDRRRRLCALLESVTDRPLAFVDGRDADLIVRDPTRPEDAAGDDGNWSIAINLDGADPGVRARRAIRVALDHARMRREREAGRTPLDAFFDLPHAAFAFVGRRGALLRANRHLAELLGTSPERLVGVHVDDLLAKGELPHELRRFRTRSTVTAVVHTGERRYGVEGREPVGLHLVITRVTDTAGRPAYYFVQASPVRERAANDWTGNDSVALLAAIRRVQAMAMRGSHPRIVFNEILRHYQKLTGSADAILALVEQEFEFELQLRMVAVQSPKGYLGYDQIGTADGIPLTETCQVIRRSIESGQPASAVAPGRLWSDLDSDFEARNALILPLKQGSRVVGLVILTNASPDYAPELVENLKPFTTTSTSILASHVEAERRVRVEEELLESRRTFETLLAHLPGMAYRCNDDDQRTVLFASEGCRELFGVGPDVLVNERGGSLLEHVHPADRRAVLEEIRWTVLQGRRFELTYRVLAADGAERWVWEQGQGVRSTDGELLFVEGFVTNVTEHRRADEERRRLEARIRRAHKVESLGVLAGGIAHDFNNLLMGVLGNAQLLRERLLGDSDTHSALTEIEDAAQRASELTDHMLSYTGQGAVTLHPIEPTEVLRRTLAVVERLMPPSATLEVDLVGGLPGVMGDAGLIQRSVVELVRNSVDAFPNGVGRVSLRTSARQVATEELIESWLGARLPSGLYVTITVSDDGQGMDEQIRQRAFDPFFTTKGTGRGMGLATVLGAVRAHGGAVHLSSEVGGGTRVTLILPPAEEPAVELRPAASPTPMEAGSPSPTILVVDDEVVVREVARRALTRAGYRVLCAVDGEDAIAQFDEHGATIDAVLLDLTMPRLSGEQTLNELRRRRTDLPVLLSSGFAEHAVMDRLAGREGVHFLHKPYRLGELVEKLRAALAGAERVP